MLWESLIASNEFTRIESVAGSLSKMVCICSKSHIVGLSYWLQAHSDDMTMRSNSFLMVQFCISIFVVYFRLKINQKIIDSNKYEATLKSRFL